jgi:hypothetical protein
MAATSVRTNVRHLASIACALAISASALHAQWASPPSRVARISALVGEASLQPSGATDWSEAALNYTVTTGDRIYTAQGSRIELEIGPMSVRIADNSDVTVTNLTDGFMQLGVAQGTLRLSVYRLPRGDSIEVDTPNGAVIVTTPGEYRIDIPDNTNYTVVSADAGSMEIIGPGIYQALRAGQAVQLSGTDPIRAVSIPRPRLTSFDQWGADRDRRLGSAACSRYMSRDIPGCADLDEAGRWESNAEYGAVWYPSRVSADWVPYRDGRWVWIEPWGWSWVADEPWGYAPFHYGRWARFGPAWGWIPGPVEVRPYYAPALVAFIGGSGWSVGVSIGTQAWFPLGPREAYIPSYHHDDAYLRQVNITNIRNVTNINTIINVQNVSQVNYVNRSAGVTAVAGDVFRSGRPVGREAVRVRPEDVARAPIISHPTAAPVERAALGGRPAARPPVAPRPAMITTAAPRPEQQAAPGNRGAQGRGAQPPGAQQRGGAQPPPTVVPKTPLPREVKETPPPTAAAPPIPPATKPGAEPPGQQRAPRAIITRTPPPPQVPPFKAREPALKVDPGKPLEPQQVQNVRAGRPAGPPKDPENPPHKVVPPLTATPTAPPVKTELPKGQPAKSEPAKGKPAKEPPKGGKPDTSTGRGRGKPLGA